MNFLGNISDFFSIVLQYWFLGLLPIYILFAVIYFKKFITKKWFLYSSLIYFIFLFISACKYINAMIYQIETGASHFWVLAQLSSDVFDKTFILSIITLFICFVIIVVRLIKYNKGFSKLIISMFCLILVSYLTLPNFLFSIYTYKQDDIKALKCAELAQDNSFFNFQRYGIARYLNFFKKIYLLNANFPFDIKEYGGYKKLLERNISTQEFLCKSYYNYDDCAYLGELYILTENYDKVFDLTNLLSNNTIKLLGHQRDYNAVAYALKKDYKNAVDYVINNEQLNGGEKNRLLADIYADMGNYKKAIEYANKLKTFSQYDEKIRIYNKMGNYKAAQKEYEKTNSGKDKKPYEKSGFRTYIDFYKIQQQIIKENIKKYN